MGFFNVFFCVCLFVFPSENRFQWQNGYYYRKDMLLTCLFLHLPYCIGSITFEDSFMKCLGLAGVLRCLYGTHHFMGTDKGQAALGTFVPPYALHGVELTWLSLELNAQSAAFCFSSDFHKQNCFHKREFLFRASPGLLSQCSVTWRIKF